MKERAEAAGIALLRRPVGTSALAVYVPERPDDLLDALTEEEFQATDERLPYFSTLWPAGESLALDLLDLPPMEGRRVLDLGCGVGAVGLAALARGARVTFFDWEPRSLAIVRLAAESQGLFGEAYVAADWRDPPPLGTFDLVLGADLLYEARNLPAVARFLAAHLAPEGEAWIADPGRPGAETLGGRLAPQGLEVVGVRELTPRADGIVVRIYRVACAG